MPPDRALRIRARQALRKVAHDAALGGAEQKGYDVSAEPPQKPDGCIDEPAGGVSESAPTQVSGWAMFDSETVSRIDIRADGRSLGNVRLGLPRSNLASISTAAHAPICGFEGWLHPEHLSPDAEQVTFDVEVRGTRGGWFALTPVTRRIIRSDRENRSNVDDDSEHVLRVQKRIRRVPRCPHTRTDALRLLAFSHRLERSGAPLYLLTLLRRLVAEGIECAVISLEDGPLRREFESAGIAVHVSYMTWPDAVRYESKLWELVAWAAPQAFDLVHVNTLQPFIGIDLAERLGVPAIWAIHEGFTPDEWFAVNLWDPHPHVLERMLSGFRTATVLLGTDVTRARLLSYSSAERLVTLPYGIDLEQIDAYRASLNRRNARERLGFAADDTVVLSIATIEPRKGQTVMAQAFAALPDHRTDSILMLVGETGRYWDAEYVEGLREFIRRSGMDSRIRIAPVTPDYYEWMAVADIFLLASDVESLPLSVLEAAAFELPIVATKVSGIPEVVQDGVTGFLCEPCDVSDLTRSLARAVSLTPPERRHAGRIGAEIIRDRHDVRSYAAQYSSLARALVAAPGAFPADALVRDGRHPASDPSHSNIDSVVGEALQKTTTCA